MNNGNRIRSFTDKQLARFLWIWKINGITQFLQRGGQGQMNVKEIQDWIDTDDWECTETHVGDDWVFDANYEDKD